MSGCASNAFIPSDMPGAMHRLAVFVPLALVIASAPFAACSGGDGESVDDADARVRRDVTHSDGIAIVPDQPTEPPPRRPLATDDNGWIEIRFREDYDCAFYAAPSPEKMPPPITWEPCGDAVRATWPSCRRMKIDWPTPTTGNFAGRTLMGTAAWVDANGHAWLAVNRVGDLDRTAVVGEADGAIHHAIAQHNPNCSVYEPDLQDARVIWTAAECGGPVDDRRCNWHGAIGGRVDELPRLVVGPVPTAGAFRAGANVFAEMFTLRSWSDGGALGTPPPRQGVFPYGREAWIVGDRLFYVSGNLDEYRWISQYSVATGASELISFGRDISAWAGGFRTDGKDMVWVEAFGRSSPSYAAPWAVINLMAAPFTTDASAIQKRRLRSGSTTDLSSGNWETVGCGYASFTSGSPSQHAIVRLSDGRSWGFDDVKGVDAGADGGAEGLVFGNVMAITCDEVFLEGHSGYVDRLVRIRLDDLGPGTPAD